MTINNKSLICLSPVLSICLAVFLTSSCAFLKTHDQNCKVTTPAKWGAEPLSIIQLIATPKLYDGKEVVIIGFVSLEFENTAVYLGRSDYESGLILNSIALEVSEPLFSKLDKDYKGLSFVQGTFRANSQKGRTSSRAGVITNVAVCYKWPPGSP